MSKLREVRINVLDSIVKMLQLMNKGSIITLGSHQGLISSIHVDGEVVLEIEDHLVSQLYSKLDLDSGERIALAKLSDSLQYVESLMYKEENYKEDTV